MIPIPAALSAYPLRYFGHKGKLLQHILPLIPKGTSTLFEPFGGTGAISWSSKCAGIRVVVNDILRAANLRHRAFIANNTELLTDEDLAIMSDFPSLRDGPFSDRYLPIFGKANARYMDGLIQNIPRLSTPAKRDLATILPIIVSVEHLPFDAYRFTPTGSLTGFQHLCGIDIQRGVELLARTRLPKIIINNGQTNEAHLGDALDLIPRVKADVMYVDTPYVADSGIYESMYAVLDDWIRYLQNDIESIRNTYDVNADLPPYTPFHKRTTAIAGFMSIFQRAAHVPLILLSYNTTSGVRPEELVVIAKSFGRDVSVQAIPYTRPTTVMGGNAKTEEVLIRCEAS